VYRDHPIRWPLIYIPKYVTQTLYTNSVDELGYHLLKCNKQHRLTRRHNAVAYQLHRLISLAGIDSTLEKSGEFDGSKKRPDISIYNSPIHDGNKVLLDVQISHARSISTCENAKLSKYADLAADTGAHFIPIIFTALGAWSLSTEDLVKGLRQRASERLNIPYAPLINSWTCRISTVLQKQNASLILDHLDVLRSARRRSNCS